MKNLIDKKLDKIEKDLEKFPAKNKYKPAIEAIKEFCHRVENGEIKSKQTYSKFVKILKDLGES